MKQMMQILFFAKYNIYATNRTEMTKYEKTCFKIVSIFVKKIYLCGIDFEKTVKIN